MTYSRTFRDGTARDEALKRRSGAVRQALGLKPALAPDKKQPAEQKSVEKPNEPKAR
jgi:hypothetical protein